MKNFLNVTDTDKQQSFTEIQLVREAFLLPDTEQAALEKKAKKLRLSKTDLIRIGLQLVNDTDSETLYDINDHLPKKPAGKKKK